MNKVITLNLQGNAFQLEDSGYEVLRSYLETAAGRLAGNPDKDEIIADIESAIADKFRATLGPHKTVVLTSEVQQVLAEMGPVEDASDPAEPKTAAAGGTGWSGAGGGSAGTGDSAATAPKRLYKIHEGAMLGGVCNGLAAFTHIDVTIIRVLFAILTLTYGSGILLYLLLFFLLPPAETPAEKAAAFGGPSTAQEFIRRAREGYYEGMKTFHDRQAHREWRRKFKREMRDWRRGFRREMHATAYQMGENWHRHWGQPPPPAVSSWVALPFLSLARLGLGLLWLYASFSLVASGAVFGLKLPADVPLWIGLLFLFVAYRFVVWPLRAARHAYYFRFGYRMGPCAGMGSSVVSIAVLVALVWLADRYIPEAHAALQNLPPTVHHTVDSIREWWARR